MEKIEKLLAKLRSNRSEFLLYQKYYEGQHEIIDNYAMQDSRANMKVVCNFLKRFIDEEISYTLANPINYIPTDGNIELTKEIDLSFSTWGKVHDIELLKSALIFGHTYEINYLNSDGEFKAGVISPLNMIAITDESLEKKITLAIHLFRKNAFDDAEYLDVYEGNSIYHYKLGTGDGFGEAQLTHVDNHIFSDVPITINYANMESKPLLNEIKSLNDAYNNVLSDLVNEVSDFRNAFLTIIGAEIEKDDVGKLKEEGIIQVPPNAKVDFLIKNINDSFVQNLLNNLEKKIYQMAAHLDHNEKIQANTSSLALRSRLIALENKCSLLQSMLELTIKQRLRRFLRYLEVKTGVHYDYRTIKLKFTSNVPQDMAVIAQVITQLQNTISQETALSLLPFIENPKLELERFKKEQEINKIDFDRLKDTKEE